MLAPANTNKDSEVEFRNGTLAVQWVPIPDAGALTDVQLEAAADAAGAFRFARPEDAAWNDANRDQLVFVTTGEGRIGGAVADGVNRLGRIYELDFNPADVTKSGRLTVAVNADDVIAAGGDTALSPDNIDIGQGYLMVNEDGTSTSRAAMTSLGRDGSIWRFAIAKQGVDGVLGQAGGRARPAGHGTGRRSARASGRRAASSTPPTSSAPAAGCSSSRRTRRRRAPAANTVEDGQLLLLTETP